MKNITQLKLKYVANPYFIEQPILFYQTFIILKDETEHSISVGYEYEKLGNGYNLNRVSK
ncbi:hypothetical protein GCM10023313_32390 [Mucilaginibacter defluvii]|uniref:Uncharacterized protein n=1 Tax=Mucilaginibacter defluvii TaxID=1196019 RepID=A0ABP9G109_9SPHI